MNRRELLALAESAKPPEATVESYVLRIIAECEVAARRGELGVKVIPPGSDGQPFTEAVRSALLSPAHRLDVSTSCEYGKWDIGWGEDQV